MGSVRSANSSSDGSVAHLEAMADEAADGNLYTGNQQ
jgi:hypothetical protein